MRAARWALIFFQFFFVNVFVPGHTRGAVTIDGKREAPCCERMARAERMRAGKAGTGKGSESDSPTSKDRQCCAVCYLVSHYTPVEPMVFDVGVMELIRQAHAAAVGQVRSVDFHLPYWPAGPPALG